MSKFGTKTYGRKQEVRINTQVDQLSNANSKATSAKMSVAAVHRWGVTSFTSLRKTHVNGQKDEVAPSTIQPSKVCGLDSRAGDPFSFDADKDTVINPSPVSFRAPLTDSFIQPAIVAQQEKPVSKPKKFFKSRGEDLNKVGSSGKGAAEQKIQAQNSRFDSLRSTPSTTLVTLKPKNSNSEPLSKVVNPPSVSDDAPNKDIDVQLSSTVLPRVLEKQEVKYPSNENLFAPPSPPQNCSPAQQLSVSVSSSRVAPPTLNCKRAEETTSSARPTLRTYSRKRVVEPAPLPQDQPTAPKRTFIPFSVNIDADQSDSRSTSHDAGDVQVLEVKETSLGRTKVKLLSTDESLESSQSGSPVNVVVKSQPSGSQSVTSVKEEKPGGLKITLKLSNITQQQQTPQATLSVKRKEKVESGTEKASSSSSSGISKEAVKYNDEKPRNRKIFSSSKKPRATYKMRHWQSAVEEDEMELQNDLQEKKSLADEFDEDENEFSENHILTKEIRPPKQPWNDSVTAVKCPKKVKELYTVVKNVKKAYQCHESGETQEFNDDIEYLLEGVQSSNPIGTRCLSVVSLASKCMVPAFRIHLRAHGIICNFFSALTDAPSEPSLSLCTATLFFVLSQDRLTMDLEASTLSLMLQLLDSDSHNDDIKEEIGTKTSILAEKHREKVQSLCEQMQQKGHAKHLNLNNINTGTLAMETLLSLTSRRAGEWFKEELRIQGGVDHIVNTVNECIENLKLGERKIIEKPTDFHIEKLKKIDRCSRVIENVTYMNFENQNYLICFKDNLMVSCYIRLLHICEQSLMLHPVYTNDTVQKVQNQITSVLLQNIEGPGAVFFSCLLSVLRVLLNITHESSEGSNLVGSQTGFLQSLLLCILQVPRCVPNEQRFDLLVLSLGLLINLVEHCEENRKRLINTQTVASFDSINDGMELDSFSAIMDLFSDKLEAAKRSEEHTDALLDTKIEPVQESKENGKESESGQTSSQQSALSQAEDLEETIMKALQKAGKNMEQNIVCAYIALLLGCVIQNNKEYADKLRDHTNEGNFNSLVESLKKFHNFINLTGVLGTTGTKSIQRVIEVLEKS